MTMDTPREEGRRRGGRLGGLLPVLLSWASVPALVGPALLAGLALLSGVVLWPATAGAASLSLDAGPVVLGRTESVGVTLRVEEPQDADDAEARPLRLSVNVGSFGEVTRVSPGVYRTEYHPPATRFPQVALVALWRETGPEAPLHFLRLPLYGATRLPVSAPPGAKVTAAVGLDTFGPVVTDKRGRAEIPLVVPPMVREASLTVTAEDGTVTRRRLPVASAPYNRLTLALVPHALKANGQEWARVEVFYDVGREVRPDEVELTPGLGRAEFVRAEPGGRLVYRYVPPAGTRAREVEFRARVAGDAQGAGRATLSLGLPPPALVQVLPPDKPLVTDGSTRAPVRLRVLDANGLGLPGQRLEVKAEDGTLGEVREEGGGEYVVDLVPPAEYPATGMLEVSASVEGAAGHVVSGLALLQLMPARVPRAVTAKVSPGKLVADGESRASLLLDVRDAAGRPLAGAQLKASASEGQVAAPVDLGEGRYRVEYTAPDEVPAAGKATVKLTDVSGTWSDAVPVPLERQRHLLVGLRGGYGYALDSGAGRIRWGFDAWAPFRVGSAPVGVGLTVGFAEVPPVLVPGTRWLSPSTPAAVVPVTVRLGQGLVATPQFSLYLGAGGVLAFAHVGDPTLHNVSEGVGLGMLGFLSGAVTAGPGQLFSELTYSFAPVRTQVFRVDTGGLALEVGYRLALF